ncbi:hypothetical protein ACSLO8_15595, partial [Escherichia coli]
MKENNSRREFLSQSGKMVTAAALFGTSVPLAHAGVAGTLNCEANNTMKITDPHYYLDNVLLETGFDYENGVAVQTRTARQTVEIQDGKIVALRENKQHPDHKDNIERCRQQIVPTEGFRNPVQRAANPQGREVAKQDRCQG